MKLVPIQTKKNNKGKKPIPVTAGAKTKKGPEPGSPLKDQRVYKKKIEKYVLPNPTMRKYNDALAIVRAGQSTGSMYPVPRDKKTGRVGAPSKYDSSYCDLLIEHMASGGPLETFAARVHVSISTLWEWEKRYPEFANAKRIGMPKLLAWWLDLGKAMTTDDVMRMLELQGAEPFVKKRTITRYPSNGSDEHDEEVVEYHVPRGNTGTYVFIMANMFRALGWRSAHNVEVTGKGGGPIQHEAKSVNLIAQLPSEKLRQLETVLASAAESIDGIDAEEGEFKEVQ